MSAGVEALRSSCWVYRLCLEEGASWAPALDYVRASVREVHSPRHADALLVRGACNGGEASKRLLAVYRAMPAPRVVFLLGAEGARESLEKGDSGAVIFELEPGLESGRDIVEAMNRLLGGEVETENETENESAVATPEEKQGD